MDGWCCCEGGWQHHCVKFWRDLHRWCVMYCTVSMQSVKINTSMYWASLCSIVHLAKSARHSGDCGETNCSGDNGSTTAAVGGECRWWPDYDCVTSPHLSISTPAPNLKFLLPPPHLRARARWMPGAGVAVSAAQSDWNGRTAHMSRSQHQ